MTEHQNCSADTTRMLQLAEEIEDSYQCTIVRDLLLDESDRRLIVTALNGFAGAAQAVGKPVAWSYELAHAFGTRGYSDWQKHITETKPDVPADSIRNLRPLYAEQLPAEGTQRDWNSGGSVAWQTVPLPATPEMIAAAERTDAEMRAQGFANAEPEAIYYAMLDAAPPRSSAGSAPVVGPNVQTAEFEDNSGAAPAWHKIQDQIDEWAQQTLPADHAGAIMSWSDRLAQHLTGGK